MAPSTSSRKAASRHRRVLAGRVTKKSATSPQKEAGSKASIASGTNFLFTSSHLAELDGVYQNSTWVGPHATTQPDTADRPVQKPAAHQYSEDGIIHPRNTTPQHSQQPEVYFTPQPGLLQSSEQRYPIDITVEPTEDDDGLQIDNSEYFPLSSTSNSHLSHGSSNEIFSVGGSSQPPTSPTRLSFDSLGCNEDHSPSDTESSLLTEEPIDHLPIQDERGAYIGPAIVYRFSELGNHESARRLWEHLESLSPETPVFPRRWALSFADQFVPHGLYRADNPAHLPAIFAHRQGASAQVKAVKRIIALMDLNDRVVGLKQLARTENVPRYILRELRAYQKWASQDGGLDKLQPGHNTATSIHLIDYSNTTAEEAQSTLCSILRGLVSRADSLRQTLFLGVAGDNVAFQGTCVPTAYSWVVAGNIVKVFTVDPKNPLRTVQELIEIDFGIRGHSLWNAIRVAMIMCRARDEMMGIRMLIPEDEGWERLRRLEALEDA